MKPRQIFTLCAATFALGVGTTAQAVLIDFDAAGDSSFQTGDYVEDGFRISVLDGHYDTFFTSATGSTYMNIDTVSDFSFGPTSTVRLTVDGGGLFNLISLFNVDALSGAGGLDGTLTSSNGGSAALTAQGTWNFLGPLWTNVSWIDFSVGPDEGPSLWAGWDDIYVEFSVPEPGTLALLGIGLFGMGMASRKRD